MQTEHLQRVRWRLVGLGWLIAVGLASFIAFTVFALELVDPESVMGTRLQMAAVALGFFAGGSFAGLRAAEAPILHGIAIGLFSLIVWFVLNLISTVLFPSLGWDALTAMNTATLVVIQITAAVLGARSGYRIAVKGRR